MDFVKGRLVRSKAGATVDAPGRPGCGRPDASSRRRKAADTCQAETQEEEHVAPTATVLENALMESDQLLSGAIAAYDAAHPL